MSYVSFAETLVARVLPLGIIRPFEPAFFTGPDLMMRTVELANVDTNDSPTPVLEIQ
jgi:hypothetical protein